MPLFFAKTNAAFSSLQQTLAHPDAGGFVTFFGHVRARNHKKDVAHLDYEAHETIASSMFAELEASVQKRFGVQGVFAIHRLERVLVGEPAVMIAACAPHRHEAFLATRYLIDELKKQLPIWKKEVYVDQSCSWDQGACRCVDGSITDNQILRPVARALGARGVTLEGIHKKRVLLIGAGGLGCPIALNLAATGFGHVTICDPDVIHESNLARQFMFKESDIGLTKVTAVTQFLEERLRSTTITPLSVPMNEGLARELFGAFDLVVDATDCAHTKRITKKIAHQLKVPLISASVYQLEGDVQVYQPSSTSACLGCYADARDDAPTSCQNTGILTHVCSMVAALAVEKAVQVVNKTGKPGAQMILVEPMSARMTTVAIPKDPHCSWCGAPKKCKKLVRLSR